MSIVSAPESGSADYNLKVQANYNGTISIKKGGVEIDSEADFVKDEVYSLNTELENDTTDFIVTYTPAEGQSTSPINKNISVTKWIFSSGAGLFVSRDGVSSARGTEDEPIDLDSL